MVQLQRFSLFANFSVQNFDVRTARFITDFVIHAYTITDSQFHLSCYHMSPKPIFWVVLYDFNHVVIQAVLSKFTPWVKGFLLRTSLYGIAEQSHAIVHQTMIWRNILGPMGFKLGWCIDEMNIPKRNPKRPFPWIPHPDVLDLCYILPNVQDRMIMSRKTILRILEILNCFAIPSYVTVIPFLEKNPVELDMFNLNGYSLETYRAIPLDFPFYKSPFVRQIQPA